MEMGTLGGILSFALELEKEMQAYYTELAEKSAKGPFSDLARKSGIRVARMERLRREGITEMILEPIGGIDDADYRLELGPPADGDPLEKAARAESVLVGFYDDASDKAPVGEVIRALKRMKTESERNLAWLNQALER